MNLNINNLKRYIKTPPKKTKYELILFPPSEILQMNNIDVSEQLRYITLIVFATSIPKMENASKLLKLKGKNVPLRGFSNSSINWGIQYYDNDTYDTKTMLEAWQLLVDNSSTKENRIENYFGNAIISQLNGKGERTVSYKLVRIFPNSTVEVDFNSSEINKEQTFSTLFTISDVEPLNL